MPAVASTTESSRFQELQGVDGQAKALLTVSNGRVPAQRAGIWLSRALCEPFKGSRKGAVTVPLR
jgi:hypothetical protein